MIIRENVSKMSAHAVIIGLTFIICLVVAAVLFAGLARINFLRENLVTAALTTAFCFILGFGITGWIFWYPYDFVSDITQGRYLLSIGAVLTVVASLFIRIPLAVSLGTLAAVSLGVWGAGLSIEFVAQWPLWVNQVLSAVLWWSFALGYRVLAGLNPLPQTEGITISSGLILLYLFGMIPFVVAAGAAGLLGVMLIAYVYGVPQPTGTDSAPVLGFILGWIGMICYGEYALSSFVIFAMLYLLELLVAAAKLATLLPKYRDIAYNSVAAQAFASGLPADRIIKTVWSTNILLLMLGVFQINGANFYSLPLFAVLITGWQLYKMIDRQNESKTVKEVGHELFSDMKDSWNRFLGKDGKNDEPDKK